MLPERAFGRGEGGTVPVHLRSVDLGLEGGLRRVSFLGLWQNKIPQVSDVVPRGSISPLLGTSSQAEQKLGTKGLEGELFSPALLKGPRSPRQASLNLHFIICEVN